jgi:hypothetical protein
VKLSVPPLRRNLIDPRSEGRSWSSCFAEGVSAEMSSNPHDAELNVPELAPGLLMLVLRALLHSRFLLTQEPHGVCPSHRSFIDVHCMRQLVDDLGREKPGRVCHTDWHACRLRPRWPVSGIPRSPR